MTKKKNLINQPLTDKQKKFADGIVDNIGANKLTNTQIAINAGYDPESAYQRAYELLNPRLSPHVVKYISERRDELLKQNDIDPQKHWSRLHHLGLKAEEKQMLGVALRAEELRGKVAGYYIDRVITAKKTIDDMSLEEMEAKMKKDLEDNKHFIEEEKNDKKKK